MKKWSILIFVFVCFSGISICNSQHSDIKNIKVTITQNFNDGVVEIPFVDILDSIFTNFSDLNIVNDNKYDALITINAIGNCLGRVYDSYEPKFYYTGAKVEGNINITTDNSTIYSNDFIGLKKAPYSVDLYKFGYEKPDSRLLKLALYSGDFLLHIFHLIEMIKGPEHFIQYIENDEVSNKYFVSRVLRTRLGDINWWYFKNKMITSLGLSSSTTADSLLIEYLNHENFGIKKAAMSGLELSKNSKAVQYLINISMGEDKKLRDSAVYTLGEIGDIRALVPLYDLYQKIKKDTKKHDSNLFDALCKIANLSNFQREFLPQVAIKKKVKKYKVENPKSHQFAK